MLAPVRSLVVRPALEDDLLRAFEMGVSFIVSQPNYALILQWTPEGLADFVRFLTTDPETRTIVLLEVEGAVVGMLAVVMVANPFGGPPWAEEVAYWLDPDARRGREGLNLLGAAEDWARQKGATVLKMVAPWGSRIGKVYGRRGYLPLETTYILRL